MQLKYQAKTPAVLILEDQTQFNGFAAGKIGTTSGEICFNTGMTGYQEIFTDPSYFGQIVVMANAHIGNYGVQALDVESSAVKVSGLVCKKFSNIHSRPGETDTLQKYFETHAVVSISDIDTRALVRHIRMHGAMNAIISSETTDVHQLSARFKTMPSMKGLELSSQVTCSESYSVGEGTHRVALIDFGVKQNIIRSLTQRNCIVKVFPMHSTFDDILQFKPQGIMLSNGPGDPASMPNATALVAKLVQSGLPIFGICLGHQLLAQSQGLQTFKMHNGHRGINHPVKNLLSGACEITSQNHGFAINPDSLQNNSNIEITHINLNDNTIEGIQLKNKPVFSVQYHPEACPGPWDSRYLFDRFVSSLAVS